MLPDAHNITWTDRIDSPWLEMQSVRIGDTPAGTGTPDKYVLVTQRDGSLVRVDAFRSSDESFAFNDAVVWHHFLVIGWGHRVYLVHIESLAVITHTFDSYFGHLYTQNDFLLVASGEMLFRIAPDGSIVWKSNVLGIDGVIVYDVADGIINGSGEWDPPGGWQPFTLCLNSGRQINAT